jgi:Ca2+-binding RTX toxin-like protein
VDWSVTVECEPPSGSLFPIGDTEVTCTATDNAGNETTATLLITVTMTVLPTLTLPPDITRTVAGPEAVTFTASAIDGFGGHLGISCDPPSGSVFPLGPTTVDCAATDAWGNTATGGFTVTLAQADGQIVVVVDATPNHAQDFAFTAGGGLTPSSFSLDDDTDLTLERTRMFTVDPGSGYSLSQATVAGWAQTSATCNDGSPVSNIGVSAGETVTCTFTNSAADLTITKAALTSLATATADPQLWPFTELGKNFTYRVTVTNNGPATAVGVLVRDVLPVRDDPSQAGASFVSANNGGIHNDGVVLWNLGTIPAGSFRSMAVTVRVEFEDCRLTLRNTAFVQSTAPVINTGDDGVELVTPILATVGGSGGDTITGTSFNDVLIGNGGNDKISGGAGMDIICGGANNDTISGDGGADILFGDNGKDDLDGGAGDDTIRAGDGDDSVNGGAGLDTAYGEAGNDSIAGDTVLSAADRDTLYGGVGNDVIWGYHGDDLIDGGNGDDEMFGGPGDDSISGRNGNDRIAGGLTTDPDEMSAAGLDVLNGNDGNDLILGQGDADVLRGGPGVDRLHGGSGNDTVEGGGPALTAADVPAPGTVNNILFGAAGTDACSNGPLLESRYVGTDRGDIRHSTCETPAVGTSKKAVWDKKQGFYVFENVTLDPSLFNWKDFKGKAV